MQLRPVARRASRRRPCYYLAVHCPWEIHTKVQVSVLYLYATILGLIEGITEFLPISSTGHLIIAEQFFSLHNGPALATQVPNFTDDFLVIIQLPAILAVVVYFWSVIWPFGKPVEERNRAILLWTRVVAGFIPAAIIGFLFDDFIEAKLFNPITVAVALAIGGIVLIALEWRKTTHKIDDVHAIGYGRAVAVGFFQCLAMIPGTSRSAATIIGAMLLGANRAAAAEFSFFLAIPTMLGATTLKMLKGGLSYTPQQWALLAVGCIVSFLTAWAVIAMFMRYIKRHDFKLFGVYRIILGIIVLAYFLW